MAYDIWGGPPQRSRSGLGEYAFERKTLPAYDARWQKLSAESRLAFLDQAKLSSAQHNRSPGLRTVGSAPDPTGLPPHKFPGKTLEELVAGRFLEVRKQLVKKVPTERVHVPDDAVDFLTRVRTIRRFHLLAADGPVEIGKYVNYCYQGDAFTDLVAKLLGQAGIVHPYLRADEAILHYVLRHSWSDWAIAALKDPIAAKVLAVIEKGKGPVPIDAVCAGIKGSSATVVRGSLESLITHLVVFEDLDPRSFELVVGFLRVVREAKVRAALPRHEPPLEVVASPTEVGPDSSVVVDDLRTFLLEVAAEPPRLRQDLELFQKELDRFDGLLDPLPEWLVEAMQWEMESRLARTNHRARTLGLVEVFNEGKGTWLRLSKLGETWLSGGIGGQYRAIYKPFVDLPATYGYDSLYGPSDAHFLGVDVTVVKTSDRKAAPVYVRVESKDRLALREAILEALLRLPIGVFHPLGSVLDHFVYGPRNPLHLGLDPRGVSVYFGSRPIPPLEDLREDAARVVLRAVIRLRLLPLGALQAAIDAEGRLCVARGPRLEAYFGREVADTDLGGAPVAGTRVVVQPDFSVVVIGLNAAPAAELAPFCERTSRGGGQGALILKITRETVIKAVAHGLTPAAILERLERLADNPVPANVAREVREWGGWVRKVSLSTVTLVRCPDRETADRVAAPLKRLVERLNPTTLAIDGKNLGAAERLRLQNQGILIDRAEGTGPPLELRSPRKTKKKRRRY